jgi:hypothetical protein
MDAMMDQWVNQAKVDSRLAAKLVKADPKLPYITALIVAGDMGSAKRAEKAMAEGLPFDKALWRVGSYARFGFALDALDKGLVSSEHLLELLPELWSGSDPDDTDSRALALWQAARVAKGRAITDGKGLPAGNLTVYRGQDADAPFGIAWSLDRAIAEKFARGSATRQSNRGGVVYVARVPRAEVLAYLTGRGESEIIWNPANYTPEIA